MKTMKVRLNTNTDHSEVPYGPPLPRSLFLWKVWGECYEDHEDCLVTQNPATGVVTHENVRVAWEKHTSYCAGAPKCEYFLHWLVGELEKPGSMKADIEWGFA